MIGSIFIIIFIGGLRWGFEGFKGGVVLFFWYIVNFYDFFIRILGF
jgi:hypothetical protein